MIANHGCFSLFRYYSDLTVQKWRWRELRNYLIPDWSKHCMNDMGIVLWQVLYKWIVCPSLSASSLQESTEEGRGQDPVILPHYTSIMLGIIGIEKHKGIIIFRPVRITHPLRRMRHKLQVEIPSDHTYSLFWAELSRLLGEKIPVAIVGLEPGILGLQSSTLTTLPPSNPKLMKHGVSGFNGRFCILLGIVHWSTYKVMELAYGWNQRDGTSVCGIRQTYLPEVNTTPLDWSTSYAKGGFNTSTKWRVLCFHYWQIHALWGTWWSAWNENQQSS